MGVFIPGILDFVRGKEPFILCASTRGTLGVGQEDEKRRGKCHLEQTSMHPCPREVKAG